MDPASPTDARWERVEALFDAAADLGPAARAALLDAECRTPAGAADAALREEVEALLRLDTGADGFFERFGESLTAPDAPPAAAGPYRLTRRLGEGGMGEVFLGERADGAFAGQVAVKILRPGLAPDLAARVRAEASILARLDHPGIARLRDAGRLPDGRPFLVMDLAEGEPVTAYADRRRLGVNERLALFEAVCDAVAYAHRNLVVHRDLKPSNVVVVETPDGPRVVLLDFGIAKLLDDAPEGFTAPRTRTEQRLLTPEYAAPEQVRGEAVTTATDVYALGVLLYELLTGQRPYRLPTRVREAVERAILTEEPTMPSTAVTDAGAAEARATEPGRLRRRLRGDLDRIVLMALRKEPARRYAGAEALGADLARHLAGLPVEARPDSAAYRVRAFVRRHRAGTAAALALVLAAVGFGALYTVRVTAERDRAEAALGQARAATEFLAGVLQTGLPEEARGDTLTVYEAIERSLATADEALADEPGLRAEVLHAIGGVLAAAGQAERAEDVLARAAAAAGAASSADPDLDARLATTRGGLLWGQARYAEAEPYFRDALARAEAAGEPLGIAERQSNLALLLQETGRREDALGLLRTSHAGFVRHLGPAEPATLTVGTNLANLLVALGRLDEADPLSVQMLRDLREVHGSAPHPQVANALMTRVRVLDALGRRADALAAARDAHAARRALYGDDHADTAGAAGTLAALLVHDGRLPEAERLGCAAAETARHQYPDTPGATVYYRATCAAGALGQPAVALARAREAVAVAAAHLDAGHRNANVAALVEGVALAASGQPGAGRRRVEAVRAAVAAEARDARWVEWADARLGR